MIAEGPGTVTVNPAGESLMTVRMRITNMGEVIAYHNSEARIQDQIGAG